MKKIAKLVETTFTCRVTVDENASENEILEKAKANLKAKLDLEFNENVTSIKNDIECPVGTFDTDNIS